MSIVDKSVFEPQKVHAYLALILMTFQAESLSTAVHHWTIRCDHLSAAAAAAAAAAFLYSVSRWRWSLLISIDCVAQCVVRFDPVLQEL